MKKNSKSGKTYGLLALLLLGLAACTGHADHSKHGSGAAATAYQCPMKCEGEKSYPQPGSCPVCKMDLQAVEMPAGHDHESMKMDSVAVYTCPMHPEIVRNEPGTCPICKMDLVVKKKE